MREFFIDDELSIEKPLDPGIYCGLFERSDYDCFQNLEFEIKDVRNKLMSATADNRESLEKRLKQLEMNHHFMKIREAKLIQNDFALQRELDSLHKEMKM